MRVITATVLCVLLCITARATGDDPPPAEAGAAAAESTPAPSADVAGAHTEAPAAGAVTPAAGAETPAAGAETPAAAPAEGDVSAASPVGGVATDPGATPAESPPSNPAAGSPDAGGGNGPPKAETISETRTPLYIDAYRGTLRCLSNHQGSPPFYFRVKGVCALFSCRVRETYFSKDAIIEPYKCKCPPKQKTNLKWPFCCEQCPDDGAGPGYADDPNASVTPDPNSSAAPDPNTPAAPDPNTPAAPVDVAVTNPPTRRKSKHRRNWAHRRHAHIP